MRRVPIKRDQLPSFALAAGIARPDKTYIAARTLAMERVEGVFGSEMRKRFARCDFLNGMVLEKLPVRQN
ncbi:MAG: hypothetical protein WD669_08530 [Pirellulales bacterium]